MIGYEWSIEERANYDDGDFDIENHDFADNLIQYASDVFTKIDGVSRVLVLICVIGDDDGMQCEWLYAYAANRDGVWVLPEHLDDVDGNPTRKVPKRFVKELADRQKMKATV